MNIFGELARRLCNYGFFKKSLDGVLGIRTRGGRTEGVDESTGLWWNMLMSLRFIQLRVTRLGYFTITVRRNIFRQLSLRLIVKKSYDFMTRSKNVIATIKSIILRPTFFTTVLQVVPKHLLSNKYQ